MMSDKEFIEYVVRHVNVKRRELGLREITDAEALEGLRLIEQLCTAFKSEPETKP